MNEDIKRLIESETDNIICPICDGEGEYDVFCGHYTYEICRKCGGKGYLTKEEQNEQ